MAIRLFAFETLYFLLIVDHLTAARPRHFKEKVTKVCAIELPEEAVCHGLKAESGNPEWLWNPQDSH
jgi:hypothetical protein